MMQAMSVFSWINMTVWAAGLTVLVVLFESRKKAGSLLRHPGHWLLIISSVAILLEVIATWSVVAGSDSGIPGLSIFLQVPMG